MVQRNSALLRIIAKSLMKLVVVGLWFCICIITGTIDHESMARHWDQLALTKRLPVNVFPTNAHWMQKFDKEAARVVTSNASIYHNQPVPLLTASASTSRNPPVSQPTGATLMFQNPQMPPTVGHSQPFVGMQSTPLAWTPLPQPIPHGMGLPGFVAHIPHTQEPARRSASIPSSIRGKAKTPKTCSICNQAKIGTHAKSGCPYRCNVCTQAPNQCTCVEGARLVSKK
jgi:hypothetical protein